MNDSTALLIRKKKDTTGRYVWEPGLQPGMPDMLLGKPVYISDAMPTVATTAKSVLFGDFSYYTIAERSLRTLVRLNELYAANGQVGFRSVERLDGKLTLAEAVVRLTQA
jgi:HK97 family phage major capsid protein